jgi:CheY-like chemotaxis protein
MNILLIEDDPTDSKLFSAVLRTSGHDVLARGSAEQAMEHIKAQKPEVILLDLKLPGMDGLALARQLKQDKDTRHIPIVAVTAASELFSEEEAVEAGCDAYIIKPVDTRRLSAQMSEVAKRKSDETGP